MKKSLLILFLFLTSQAFSQQVERYWNYEDDVRTIYYEKVDTVSGITISEGTFIDSMKHGEWHSYWENGSLQERIFFKNGVKQGTWKFYDKEGRLVLKKKYRENKLVMAEERRYY